MKRKKKPNRNRRRRIRRRGKRGRGRGTQPNRKKRSWRVRTKGLKVSSYPVFFRLHMLLRVFIILRILVPESVITGCVIFAERSGS